MAQIEVLLPKMGESVAEATITQWLKSEGDAIEADDAIVEIATDKVDSEVPAPEDGTIIKTFFNEGDVVKVGEVIAIISTDGDSTTVETKTESPSENVSVPATKNENLAPSNETSTTTGEISKKGPSGKFYSPLVRSIAEKENISMSELESISGTGLEGRVTKNDILNYVNNRGSQPVSKVAPLTTTTASTPSTSSPAVSASKPVASGAPDPSKFEGDVEIIEMDRMRKLISKYMVQSKQTSPHVTSFVEADVTNMVMWRNKVKNDFQKREGEKITFTPLLLEAVVKAIKDFPMINVSVEGDYLIKKNFINVGMATALPSGNLIVPVIKNADQYNLVGLTKAVNSMANKARNNKLAPEDIQGGTYTISNVGSFGNVMGTPIINQPEVAILALGAIRKMPAVIETPTGDSIGVRHKMFLSHSYDHRVVDGSLGGMFVKRVAEYLESFDINREI